MSTKQLDYEELWDSFTDRERVCLIINLPYWIPSKDSIEGLRTMDVYRQAWGKDDKGIRTMDVYRQPWKRLPKELRKELLKLDWEFNLGKKPLDKRP